MSDSSSEGSLWGSQPPAVFPQQWEPLSLLSVQSSHVFLLIQHEVL